MQSVFGRLAGYEDVNDAERGCVAAGRPIHFSANDHFSGTGSGNVHDPFRISLRG